MKRISLTQYLVEQQREHGHIPAQLRLLIEIVARACKRIAIAVNKGALGEVLGTADTENVQGEVQKKLDIISNEVLIEANEWGGHLAAMASEEMDTIHVVPNRYPQGEYLLLFDPLDGSSNIDVNVSIGTIFSVLRKVTNTRGVSEEDFLQPGKLRLMYEANPMAFLVEQAGGRATNGHQRILDIVPTKLHERVSVVLGSKNEVQRVTDLHQAATDAPGA